MSTASYLKKFNHFSAKKINFENRGQEVERVAESEIVLNRHVFISIFGQEIEEKVENTVTWWVSCQKYMCSS